MCFLKMSCRSELRAAYSVWQTDNYHRHLSLHHTEGVTAYHDHSPLYEAARGLVLTVPRGPVSMVSVYLTSLVCVN